MVATLERSRWGLLACGAVGYLAGTVPFADMAAKVAASGDTDLRRFGSGNPGAVNAMAALGTGWGYAIMFADATKAALACAAGRRMGGADGAHVAGCAAVVGHCLPVWNGFRGGKGVAASMGQCFATFPAYFPLDLGVAWGVGHWRHQAQAGTVAGCATWVGCGLLWWRRGWPNGWGPRPSAALPLANAVSSAVILGRFAVAARRRAAGLNLS